MNKKQFEDTLRKENPSLQQKTDCFNYFIKHYGASIATYDEVGQLICQLSDCKIDPPTSQQGQLLLDHSMNKIRRIFT